MLPIPLPYRIAIVALCAIPLVLLAEFDGYKRAEKKYRDPLTELKSKLADADNLEKERKLKQEVISHEVEQSHDAHIQALAKFYKDANAADVARAREHYRVLSGQNPVAASAATNCAQVLDASPDEQTPAGCNPPEQTITGCPLSVEQACTLDAETVEACTDFFVKHQFPVE